MSKELAMGLKELRKRISSSNVPSSKLDETINIATWNIREFGKKPRMKESLHFIAEIMNEFDLITVIELRDNLEDLGHVLSVLGSYWGAVYSDYIPDAGGNYERIGYVYDRRAVVPTGLASEASPPRVKDKATDEYTSAISWWRSPYIASFSAGKFDFIAISAHIKWGESAKSRVSELQLLADWVDQRIAERGWEDKDIIVMGDFNIPKYDDELFKAVTGKGLRVPDAIRGVGHGSNLKKDKRYDQILHYPQYTKSFTNRAGVLDFYRGDWSKLYPGVKKTHEEFTFEISDHLPLWIQMNTDIEDERLDQIIRGQTQVPRSEVLPTRSSTGL